MSFMGIDVGNGTLKAVLLNEKDEVEDSVYLRNVGVVETLKNALSRLRKDKVEGVGVIGAGRNLASLIVGADVVKTEILAHAIGVLSTVPEAKTIMDLGFEDSKILIIRDGVLQDFSMNAVCGAGCGAYLENVSYRFGIKIEEFAGIALESNNPTSIASKCAVFGSSCCVSKLNSGVAKKDILMGVAKSLVRNYLALLGKGKRLTPPYVFVGGVSQNESVVKALEEELQHKVIVPKHAKVVGAIGAAILAKEHIQQGNNTRFVGFDLVDSDFDIESFVCDGCENACEITKITRNGEFVGYGYEGRCGKWSKNN